MADNAFNATVSDLAAVMLTDAIAESAKADNIKDITNEDIDAITPSLILGSMLSDDPVRLSKTKPTLILNQKNKDNLKNSFNMIRDRIKLSLSDIPIDNTFYSEKVRDAKEKQLDVFRENSKLISMSAISTNKTRQLLASDKDSGGSGDDSKGLKTPDDINSQISKLNRTISAHPAASAINMGVALSEFWSDFTFEQGEGSIENKLSGMVNATSASTSERIKKSTDVRVEELESAQPEISGYNNKDKASINDRYKAPETDNVPANIDLEKPQDFNVRDSETPDIGP